MGREQDTFVLRSSIDLPPIADLADPRLPRAFRGWVQFAQIHNEQIEKIGLLQPNEVVSLAKELSDMIGQAIGISEKEDKPNVVCKERVAQLTEMISGMGNRVIFMRHGEQSPPQWISSLENPALRKIRMMQDPFNRQDLLTNNGLIDVFIAGLALRYVRDATGKTVKIFSSENLRSKEVAYIFHTVIPGSSLATLEGLNCITYKNEMDQPPVSEEDLLTDLPSGMMPWNPQLVDKLCKRPKSGISQSEAIINTVGSLIDCSDRKNGNKLAIVVTHNQQIAEVLRQTGKLEDPSVRFPELTMMVVKNNDCLVLEQGVLYPGSGNQFKTKRSMRSVLEIFGYGYEWYKVRRAEYQTEQRIPFRVSPSPLTLSHQESQELLKIGGDIVNFVNAADELYRTEGDIKELLDRGKPDFFTEARRANYLFVRPDVIITQGGFSICEIETSPFGLALAELLNRSYRFAGFDTLVGEDVLRKFITEHTFDKGAIVYSQHTASYAGQLQFLADKIFSWSGRKWDAKLADEILSVKPPALYRGFYLHECLVDSVVDSLVKASVDHKEEAVAVIPSSTPYLEEKALLALVWDKRWDRFLSAQLGTAGVKHLREVIPPTWIIGQEQFFLLGLPGGITSSEGLASLSRSKRNFVLKKSGFGSGSSWAEGVSFLQEKSAVKVDELIHQAVEDKSSLYVVQEFRKAEECKMFDEGDGSSVMEMAARIRITPYFSMIKDSYGKLIAIKATGCENTNYIHASTGSINTAVM